VHVGKPWPLVGLLACLLGACSAELATEQSAAGVPQRIVTLAPHLAELVYAAGAGAQLVGVSAYSNYPPAVQSLPVVGDAFMLDQERLAVLQPDLLLVWESGTPAHVVDELRTRGHRVEVLTTRGLDDVANALQQIGELTGHVRTASAAADAYRQGLNRLARDWTDAAAIRVFYQVSSRPLYTVNGSHYVSELIALCGGRNIFADLNELAPLVAEEAVLNRDPEILLAADTGDPNTFAAWSRWPSLSANRYRNHFLVPADEIGRPTPRLLEAGAAVCAEIERGRQQRGLATQ
jgi:iron complex transport system substrate-binding protein